jgi:hypothetical protein
LLSFLQKISFRWVILKLSDHYDSSVDERPILKSTTEKNIKTGNLIKRSVTTEYKIEPEFSHVGI